MAIAAMVLISITVSAQEPPMASPSIPVPAPGASPLHPVYMKFTNAATGAAVAPSSLLIDGSAAKFDIEAASLVVISVPEGQHRMEIQAEGFHPLESSITVSAGTTPVMGFELDPMVPQEAAAVAKGSAVVEGHVTDSDTGELMQGVEVTVPDSDMTTTTDETGRFEFELQVPKALDTGLPAITLEARAADYVPLRIKNLKLTAGERRRTPFTLERKTSDTATTEVREVDEAAEAGSHRSFEWVFDATIR